MLFQKRADDHLDGLCFGLWPDKAQDKVIRISDILQPTEVGVIHISRGDRSAFEFEFSNPFLIACFPCTLDMVF